MPKKAKKLTLPEWAQPNRRELERILSGPTDAEIEHAIFGVSSMHGTVWLDAGDITWDPSRQGRYQDVLAEVEENPDEYHVEDPLIVDFKDDGTLVLNDGHHRYAKGTEEGVTSFQAEIQFSPGQARRFLEAIAKNGLPDEKV